MSKSPEAETSGAPQKKVSIEFNPADGVGFTEYCDRKRPGGNQDDEPCFVCKDNKNRKGDRIVLCDGECGWGAHRSCLKVPDGVKLPQNWWCSEGCKKAHQAKASEQPQPSPALKAPARAPDTAPGTAPARNKKAKVEPVPAPGSAPPAQQPKLVSAPAAQPAETKRKAQQETKTTGKGKGARPATAEQAGPALVTTPAPNVVLPGPVFVNDIVTVESRMAILGALGRLLRHVGRPQAARELVGIFRNANEQEALQQVTYHYTEMQLVWEAQDVEGVLAVFKECYGLNV